MKKLSMLSRLITSLFITAMVLPGCLKDTVSRTYKMYIPVYKTTAQVRANIKSAEPVAVTNPGKLFYLATIFSSTK